MRYLAVGILLCVLAVANADDEKKLPKIKKRPAFADEVPARAMARAKSNPFKIQRLTVTYDNADEDTQKILAIVEYENKTYGIYAGYADEKEDQYIIIDRDNLDLIKETISRCYK